MCLEGGGPALPSPHPHQQQQRGAGGAAGTSLLSSLLSRLRRGGGGRDPGGGAPAVGGFPTGQRRVAMSGNLRMLHHVCVMSAEFRLRLEAVTAAPPGLEPSAPQSSSSERFQTCARLLLRAGASPVPLLRLGLPGVGYDGIAGGAGGDAAGANLAPVLLAFGSQLPERPGPDAGEPVVLLDRDAAVARHAQRAAALLLEAELCVLRSPAAAEQAAARLEARVAEALASTSAATGAGGGGDAAFARLRVLQSAPLRRWEAAWRSEPPGALLSRPMFGAAVDRLAWAKALLAAAERAEAEAAARSVGVLQQLEAIRRARCCSGGRYGGAEETADDSSSDVRRLGLLTFAAAACVAKWAEISQQGRAAAQKEVAAAEAGVADAGTKAERSLARMLVAAAGTTK